MRLGNLLVVPGVLIVFLYSCSAPKAVLDLPEQFTQVAEKITISGVKGSGFPGTRRKLKFDQGYTGQFKNGWRLESSVFDQTPGGMFSAEAFKRSVLSNYGLDINEVSEKTVDKFQFRLSDGQQSLVILCKQQTKSKSTNYQYLEKREVSILKKESSSFVAIISFLQDSLTKGWRLEMANNRENPDGSLFGMLQQGLSKENGILTNGIDSVYISPVLIKSMGSGKGNDNTAQMLFEMVGGYDFKKAGQVIGVVNLFNPAVWHFPSTEDKDKTVITAAATALLLRNR